MLVMFFVALLVEAVLAEQFYARLNQRSNSASGVDVSVEYYGEVWVDAGHDKGEGLRVTVAHNVPVDARCNEGDTTARCLVIENTADGQSYLPNLPTSSMTNLAEYSYTGDGSDLPLHADKSGTRYFNLTTDLATLRAGAFKIKVLYNVDPAPDGSFISGYLLPLTEPSENVLVETDLFAVQGELIPGITQSSLNPFRFAFKVKPALLSASQGKIFKLQVTDAAQANPPEVLVTFNMTSHPNSVTEGTHWAFISKHAMLKEGRYTVVDANGITLAEGEAEDSSKEGYFELQSFAQTQQVVGYLQNAMYPAVPPVTLAPVVDESMEIKFFCSYNNTPGNTTLKARYEILGGSAPSSLTGMFAYLRKGAAFVDGSASPIVAVLGDGWVWLGENVTGTGEPDYYVDIANTMLNDLKNGALYLSIQARSSGPEIMRGQVTLVIGGDGGAQSRLSELYPYASDVTDDVILENSDADEKEGVDFVYEQPAAGLLRVRSYGNTMWGVVEGFRASPFANQTFPPNRVAGSAFDYDVTAQILLGGRPVAVGGFGGWQRVGGLIRFSLFEKSLQNAEGKIGRKALLQRPPEQQISYGVRAALEDYSVSSFSAQMASNSEAGYFVMNVAPVAATQPPAPGLPENAVSVTWNLTHTLQGLDGVGGCSRNFSCLVLVRDNVVVANLLRGRHAGPASEAPISGVIVADDIHTDIQTIKQGSPYSTLHLNDTITTEYTLSELASDVVAGKISVVLLTASHGDVSTGGYFSARLAPTEPPRALEFRSEKASGRLGVLLSSMQIQFDVAAVQNNIASDDFILQAGLSLSVKREQNSASIEQLNDLSPHIGTTTTSAYDNTADNVKVYKGTSAVQPFYRIRGVLGATNTFGEEGAASIVLSRLDRTNGGVLVEESLSVLPVGYRGYDFYSRLLFGGGTVRREGSFESQGVDVLWKASVSRSALQLNYTCGGCGADAVLSEPTNSNLKNELLGDDKNIQKPISTTGFSATPIASDAVLYFSEGEGNSFPLTPRLLNDMRAGWRTLRVPEEMTYGRQTAPILTDEAADQFSALLVPSTELASAVGGGKEGLTFFTEVELALSVHPASGLVEITLAIPTAVKCVSDCVVTSLNSSFGSFAVNNVLYAAAGTSYQASFEHVLPVSQFYTSINPPYASKFILQALRGREIGDLELATSGLAVDDTQKTRFEGIEVRLEAVYPGALRGFVKKTFKEVYSMSCAGGKGKMQGIQVVPPVKTDYTGELQVNVDSMKQEVTVAKAETNVPQTKGTYIGIGRVGQRGDLRQLVEAGNSFKIDLDLIRALASGFAFGIVVPIHYNEGGEVRCQMIPAPGLTAVTNKKNLYVDSFAPSPEYVRDTKKFGISDSGALQSPMWLSLFRLYPSGLTSYQITSRDPPSDGQIVLKVDPNVPSGQSRYEVQNSQLASLTSSGSVSVDLAATLNTTYTGVMHSYPWEVLLMRKTSFVKFNVTSTRYPGGEMTGTVRSSSEGSIFTAIWESVNYNAVYEDAKVDFVVSDMVTPFFYGFDTDVVDIDVTCDGENLLQKLPVRTTAKILDCMRSGLTTVVITNTTSQGVREAFTGVVVPDDVAPIYNFETNLAAEYLVPNTVATDTSNKDPKIVGRVIMQIIYSSNILLHFIVNYDYEDNMRAELACDMKVCGDDAARSLSCITLHRTGFLYSDTGSNAPIQDFDVCNPLFSLPTVKPANPIGDKNTAVNRDVLNAIPQGGFLSVTVEGSPNDDGGVLGLALELMSENVVMLFNTKTFTNGAARADMYKVSPLSNLGLYNESTDSLTDIRFSSRPAPEKVDDILIPATKNATRKIGVSYNRVTKQLFSDFCLPRSQADPAVLGGLNNGCVFSYITLFGGGRSNMTNVLLNEFPNARQVGWQGGGTVMPGGNAADARPEGGFLFYSGDTVSEGVISAMITGRLQIAGNEVLDASDSAHPSTHKEIWKEVHAFQKEAFSWLYPEEPADFFLAEVAPAYLPVPVASYSRTLVALHYHPSSFMLRYDVFVDPTLVGKRCYGAGCIVLQSASLKPGSQLPQYSASLIDLYDFAPYVTTGGVSQPSNAVQSLKAEYHGFIPASSHVLSLLTHGNMVFLLSDAAKAPLSYPASDLFASTQQSTQTAVPLKASLDGYQLRVPVDTTSLTQVSADTQGRVNVPGVFEENGRGSVDITFTTPDKIVAVVSVKHNMKLGTCPLYQKIGCFQMRIAPYGEEGSIGAVVHNGEALDPQTFRTKPLPISAVRALQNGWAYFNIHAIKAPTGAIRGQLLPANSAPIASLFETTYVSGAEGQSYIVQTSIRITPTGAGFAAKIEVLTNYTVPPEYVTSEESALLSTKIEGYQADAPLLSAVWSVGGTEVVLDISRAVNYVYIDAAAVYSLWGTTQSTMLVKVKGWNTELAFRTVEQSLKERLCKTGCNEFFAKLQTYNTAPTSTQTCVQLEKADCLSREVCSWTASNTCVDASGFVSAAFDMTTKSFVYNIQYDFNGTFPPPDASCVESPKLPGCAFLQLGGPGMNSVETRLSSVWTQTEDRPTTALSGFKGSVRLSSAESWALTHGSLNLRIQGSHGVGMVRGTLLPAPFYSMVDLIGGKGGVPASSNVNVTDLYAGVRGVKYPQDAGVVLFTSVFANDPEGFFYAEFFPGTGDQGEGVGILRYVLKHKSIPEECLAEDAGCLYISFASDYGYSYNRRIILDYGRRTQISGEEGKRIVQGEVQVTAAMLLVLSVKRGVVAAGAGAPDVNIPRAVEPGVVHIIPTIVVGDKLGRPQDVGSVDPQLDVATQTPGVVEETNVPTQVKALPTEVCFFSVLSSGWLASTVGGACINTPFL